MRREIDDLLKRKIAGEELNLENRVIVINNYIDKEIEYLTAVANTYKNELDDPTERLDQLYRKYLEKVWK